MKKISLTILIILLILILGWQFFLKDANIKLKGEALLSWNQSMEKDSKGYKIYYGEKPRTDNCPSGGYKNKIDVGNVTNYKIKKLENNKTYYFSVTSYNQAGKESCFSQEMHKEISIKFLDKINKIISQK